MTAHPQPHAANLPGLDYRAQAEAMGPPCTPIIDIHLHLRGDRAVALFKKAADAYGIHHVVSMTPFDELDPVRSVLGDRVQFTAVPNWRSDDPMHAHGVGFSEHIRAFAAEGAKLCKFWCAPRALDYAREMGQPDLMRLDGDMRRGQIELAAELGMGIMTHIADPDTWFQTTYADADRYGTKMQQYEALERMLEAVKVPWLAAHMGGHPEDLDHLDLLLERHPHLHLDTSATKWMVRELSRHDSARLGAFLKRWMGRICFGSDIVTQNEHLHADDDAKYAAKAESPDEAFDLYASRYWALRTLWEGTWQDTSPIADPDLHMVNASVDPMAAPLLKGHAFDASLLKPLYADAASGLLSSIG